MIFFSLHIAVLFLGYDAQGFRNSAYSSRSNTSRREMVVSSKQLWHEAMSNKPNGTKRKGASTNPYPVNQKQNLSLLAMQKIPQKNPDGNYVSNKISQDSNDKGSKLPSSFRVDEPGFRYPLLERVRNQMDKVDVRDAAIITTYACTQIAISLPVILIPVIAVDPFGPGVVNNMNTATFVGSIVSISTFGAGCGKIVNGFVCQAIGGRQSGVVYMLGLAFFSLLLSTTYSIHGYAIAGMEFCASMMWTAMSVLMAERYEKDAVKFTSAIMSLSLASTTGTLIAKTFGGVLLSQFHWRQVCLLSTCAGLLGAVLLYLTTEADDAIAAKVESTDSVIDLSTTRKEANKNRPSVESIQSSFANVIGNKMFFAVAFAHFTSFIVRSSDKVLGSFIVDATDLPRYLAGSLTTSMTLGFILGLVTGKKVEEFENVNEKKSFILRRYIAASSSAIGLAILANETVGNYLGQYGLAAAITVVSGLLATSVGFQFYQLPIKYSPTFGRDKAVFISWCDGVGFLLLSPFWSSISGLVANYGLQGWTFAWLIVAVFIAMGGTIMTRNLEAVMRLDKHE